MFVFLSFDSLFSARARQRARQKDKKEESRNLWHKPIPGNYGLCRDKFLILYLSYLSSSSRAREREVREERKDKMIEERQRETPAAPFSILDIHYRGCDTDGYSCVMRSWDRQRRLTDGFLVRQSLSISSNFSWRCSYLCLSSHGLFTSQLRLSMDGPTVNPREVAEGEVRPWGLWLSRHTNLWHSLLTAAFLKMKERNAAWWEVAKRFDGHTGEAISSQEFVHQKPRHNLSSEVNDTWLLRGEAMVDKYLSTMT